MKTLNQFEDLYLTETENNILQAYLDHLSEEQKKAFVATYMYILNVGNGDAQFESQISEYTLIESILDAEELSVYKLDENLVGSVIAFFKGKKTIGKYYKGLDAAAKNYISASKNIDKLDQDKRADKRKSALDTYNKTIKSLDVIKNQLEELKKESKILAKLDAFAANKYKIKLVLSGRKTGVSLAKMKGYSDNLDKIKDEQNNLKAELDKEKKDIKAAEKEKKRLDKENKKSKGDSASTDEPNEEGEPKEKSTKEKVKEKIDSFKKAIVNFKKKIIQEPDKKESIESSIDAKEAEIEKLEKKIEENGTLPLSFFTSLQSLNEDMKCLEDSIEERL